MSRRYEIILHSELIKLIGNLSIKDELEMRKDRDWGKLDKKTSLAKLDYRIWEAKMYLHKKGLLKK